MKRISFGRHKRNCSICNHPDRDAIEEGFVAWESGERIAERFGLGSKYAVYRHATACGLNAKRSTNLRSALERFVEKLDCVEPTAAAIVSAVGLLARINKAGEWIPDPADNTLDALFGRMSRVELENYATRGALPDWFAGGSGDPKKTN